MLGVDCKNSNAKSRQRKWSMLSCFSSTDFSLRLHSQLHCAPSLITAGFGTSKLCKAS